MVIGNLNFFKWIGTLHKALPAQIHRPSQDNQTMNANIVFSVYRCQCVYPADIQVSCINPPLAVFLPSLCGRCLDSLGSASPQREGVRAQSRVIHGTFEERMRRRNCPLWESPLRTIVNADEMEPDACPTNTVGENSGSKSAADVSRIDRR